MNGLLRPQFGRLACEIAILNRAQLIKQVEKWLAANPTPTTLFITMDIDDSYKMIPQTRRDKSNKEAHRSV